MNELYNFFSEINLTQSIIFGIVMFLVHLRGQYVGAKVSLRVIMKGVNKFYENNPNPKHQFELINYVKKYLSGIYLKED